jgi:hypothetical protein
MGIEPTSEAWGATEHSIFVFSRTIPSRAFSTIEFSYAFFLGLGPRFRFNLYPRSIPYILTRKGPSRAVT